MKPIFLLTILAGGLSVTACANTGARYDPINDGHKGPGYQADLNIIDYDRLKLEPPKVVFDLPAKGRRLIQGAQGYLATIAHGQIIRANGENTGAKPGRLIRGPQSLQ